MQIGIKMYTEMQFNKFEPVYNFYFSLEQTYLVSSGSLIFYLR